VLWATQGRVWKRKEWGGRWRRERGKIQEEGKISEGARLVA